MATERENVKRKPLCQRKVKNEKNKLISLVFDRFRSHPLSPAYFFNGGNKKEGF